MSALPVYDAVLLPGAVVEERSVRLSAWCAEFAPAEFTLRTGELYPHISLYMANFESARLGEACEALRLIGERTPEIPLEGGHFAANDQGMFELFYRKTGAVTRLQEDLLAALGPLRTGLRERDPVGRVLAEHRLVAPPEARANLDRHGYDEIGELFRPHITMTRFRERGLQVPAELLPPARSFDEVYRTLALCVMGEHGTCTEVVEVVELGSAA
ncbi:hypothetical protein FDA94_36560 [Herbidospora galbida]|uniref:2'-5' RNA ligase family protein n=1 Tax=Herbidospora galbida TaxID=2575442 RepID=A0A4U3LSE1_9ACTN|nr:hypothetical protein [Herbidospora galbida]TKK78905.1 hypothetical protein FDA94_36560 [Herbidospora galbida]